MRGNGRIIDELEALFAGAGWRVIKLVWGSDWDGLFARDGEGALARAFAKTVDASSRPSPPRTAATTATTSSARTRSSPRWRRA